MSEFESQMQFSFWLWSWQVGIWLIGLIYNFLSVFTIIMRIYECAFSDSLCLLRDEMLLKTYLFAGCCVHRWPDISPARCIWFPTSCRVPEGVPGLWWILWRHQATVEGSAEWQCQGGGVCWYDRTQESRTDKPETHAEILVCLSGKRFIY